MSGANAATCGGHRPRLRFRFFARSEERVYCLRHAVAYTPVLRNALLTAAVVGTVLTAINQGNVLFDGRFPTALYWKVPLTYSVPYFVSTWAALRIGHFPG